MPEIWRVALIDSGLSGEVALPRVSACRFVDTGTDVLHMPPDSDPIGHGTLMARIICSRTDALELMVGQVFDRNGRATPAAVAAAVTWAIAGGANLIHMSLGLREDRPILADAISNAIEAGCIVVASSPARGAVTFPARYPAVIRATGDSRCATHEISFLGSAQADYGACCCHSSGAASGGGSVGAAHLTSFIIAHLPARSTAAYVRTRLTEMARYRGTERRTSFAASDAN